MKKKSYNINSIKLTVGLCLLLIPILFTTRHIMVHKTLAILRNYAEVVKIYEVTFHDRQLAEIKPFLPSRGMITYLPDLSDEKDTYAYIDIAQFCLAPLVLSPHDICQYAVGYFPPEHNFKRYIFKGTTYCLVKRLPNGFCVFVKDQP